MTITSQYTEVKPYITQDKSEIRELMHPDLQGNKNQSLAEAIVMPSEKTLLHHHIKSEEIYYITQGEGHMQIDDETFNVNQGMSICIPPGANHCIENTGKEKLKILCCCSPAYAHDDTVIVK